jgi:thymidylate synthase (FAD)
MMFKTIEDCRLELVAHTTFPEDGVEDGGWDISDWLPVAAARASFAAEDKTGNDEAADRKLLKFLADHRHVSVFEHNYATFLVECPLFVRSQIIRHRSFTFNEMSRRYTSEQIEFWIPTTWRKQSKNNKQASTNEVVSGGTPIFTDFGQVYNQFGPANVESQFMAINEACLRNYEELLKVGVCREQARAVLPQSLLTRFYMTGNLRSWWSFLSSRLKEDTQFETRVVAQRVKDKLTNLWPESMNALFGE